MTSFFSSILPRLSFSPCFPRLRLLPHHFSLLLLLSFFSPFLFHRHSTSFFVCLHSFCYPPWPDAYLYFTINLAVSRVLRHSPSLNLLQNRKFAPFISPDSRALLLRHCYASSRVLNVTSLHPPWRDRAPKWTDSRALSAFNAARIRPASLLLLFKHHKGVASRSVSVCSPCGDNFRFLCFSGI